MAQKLVEIDGIGEVLLRKRRGTKYLKISIGASGEVKVSMPTWVPYATGIAFAKQKYQWVALHRQRRPKPLLEPGVRIGKYHRIVQVTDARSTSVVVRNNEIRLAGAVSVDASSVQQKLVTAAERALRQEAASLLPARLESLAQKYNYSFSEITIKKLTSRWGSCSAHKKITLSYYLMQLPWPMIDYVILHELAHTKHLNHSKEFWIQLESTCSDYKILRKQIKNYSPSVTPQGMA